MIETIAGFANETVIDFDAHDCFTINYLFLVDDDFFNQRVDQFSSNSVILAYEATKAVKSCMPCVLVIASVRSA